MTELVTSGSVGGMASIGCLYPETASSDMQVAGLPRETRFVQFHSMGERRYDLQGTPRAAPGCVITRCKKTPGAFFRASLQDGGESQDVTSNRSTITPRYALPDTTRDAP